MTFFFFPCHFIYVLIGQSLLAFAFFSTTHPLFCVSEGRGMTRLKTACLNQTLPEHRGFIDDCGGGLMTLVRAIRLLAVLVHSSKTTESHDHRVPRPPSPMIILSHNHRVLRPQSPKTTESHDHIVP